MQATKILKLLQDGKLDTLESAAKEEIYAQSFKSSGSARKQLSAIKRIAKRGEKLPSRMGYKSDTTGSWATDAVVAIHLDGPVPVPETDNERMAPMLSRLFSDTSMPFLGDPDVVAISQHTGAEIDSVSKNKSLPDRYVQIGPAFYDARLISDALHAIMGEALVRIPSSSNQALAIKGSGGSALVMPVRVEEEATNAYVVE